MVFEDKIMNEAEKWWDKMVIQNKLKQKTWNDMKIGERQRVINAYMKQRLENFKFGDEKETDEIMQDSRKKKSFWSKFF